MRNITICSHLAAEVFFADHPQTHHAIVVTGPDCQIPLLIEEYARSILHLQFHDIWATVEGFIAPTESDIAEVLDWAHNLSDIVVCCHQGISRSSAIGYLLQCTQMAPSLAIKILDRSAYAPNGLIIQLGAAILGNEEVLATFLAWKKNKVARNGKEFYHAGSESKTR